MNAALKTVISMTGWQQEPMTRCLTYSKEVRNVVHQTDQSVCDGSAIAICKKKIGKGSLQKFLKYNKLG